MTADPAALRFKRLRPGIRMHPLSRRLGVLTDYTTYPREQAFGEHTPHLIDSKETWS